MARPIRIEYPHAIYHIISRGLRRDNIFREKKDKDKFLTKLKKTKEKYKLEIFSYCLMDNHYHLLIRTPLGNLTKAMHYLNASYTNWFKAKHDIVGPVFQGRYKSVLVQDDSYLLTLSSYIHLNPLRAGIVEYLKDYEYNSFNEYIDNVDRDIIDKGFILRKFESKEKFRKYTYDWFYKGKKIDKKEIYGQNGFLGSKRFVDRIIKKQDKNKNFEEYSNINIEQITKEDIEKTMIKKLNIRKDDLYIKNYGNNYRNMFVYLLKKYTELKLKQIAKLFDIKYKSVSKKAKRFEKKIEKDKYLRKKVKKIEKEVKNK